MAEAPAITALAPWFGGKRRMAPAIVRQLCWDPERQVERVPDYFAEPFCGSMAVSMAMPKVQTHLVSDLHRELIGFAEVLAGPNGPALVARCERTLCCESIYDDACKQIERFRGMRPYLPDTQSAFDRAWAFYVAAWLGPNGLIGTEHNARFCARFGPGGGSPAKRFQSAADSLPWFMERLREMVILNRDAFEVIGSIQDKPGVAIYIDSPYTRETRVSGEYVHEFEDKQGATMFGAEDDHDRLAAALGRFKHARIVVSYEDCDRVRELYAGWDVIDMGQHKNTSNAAKAGRSSDQAPEVLLINNGARPMEADR